ncbi:hypothetical protein B0O80DRAFT_495087 [Mortierella sp. GBAus27b]|nr:hypothetical protein B0O80DRAFT_495087 [Mortierella sp. GBAus27b]
MAGVTGFGGFSPCFIPAYNGSKVVVVILARTSWGCTSGPFICMRIYRETKSSVGAAEMPSSTPSNKTYTYNMKAETWSSRYISPDTPASTATVGFANAYWSNSGCAGSCLGVHWIQDATKRVDTKSSMGTHGSVSDLQSVRGAQLIPAPAPEMSLAKRLGYNKDLLEHERTLNIDMPLYHDDPMKGIAL